MLAHSRARVHTLHESQEVSDSLKAVSERAESFYLGVENQTQVLGKREYS